MRCDGDTTTTTGAATGTTTGATTTTTTISTLEERGRVHDVSPRGFSDISRDSGIAVDSYLQVSGAYSGAYSGQ